jgi:circadian clock protein KaiB
MYIVKAYIYIAGRTPNSAEAVNNLRRFLEEEFEGQYSLEVINLFDNQGLAEHDNILATPTAIRTFPEPTRRIVGDMRDKEKVLLGLGLVGLDRSMK